MAINEKEFCELVGRYSNLVYSVCLQMTRDRFDSEDLTQETFLAAYRHIHRVRDDNLKAWLCRIAVNKCRDHIRKQKHAPPVTDDGMTVTECADPLAPSVEESAQRREAYSNLAIIIDALKEPYHGIAYAYYIQNIPLAQYAQANDIPLKTLQTRIARAKKMIRKIYEEEYNDATV